MESSLTSISSAKTPFPIMKKIATSSSASDKESVISCSSGAPSGFVLKLYQMVNDAPDDIVSWVSSGEAFRISDLQRLEDETLPCFFRHGRFQSLVRQLNFYNFRKVNRERTFWIYRHPLFHRDRPHDLHLLRRRTFIGGNEAKKVPVSNNKGEPLTEDESTTGVSEEERGQQTTKKMDVDRSYDYSYGNDDYKCAEALPASNANNAKIYNTPRKVETTEIENHSSFVVDDEADVEMHTFKEKNQRKKKKSFSISKVKSNPLNILEKVSRVSNMVAVMPAEEHTYEDPFAENTEMTKDNEFDADDTMDYNSVQQSEKESLQLIDTDKKQSKLEIFEQSQIVSHIAQQLQERMKLAEETRSFYGRHKGRGGRGRKPTQTIFDDTMRYNALTYDDEVRSDTDDENIRPSLRHLNTSSKKKTSSNGNVSVVTDDSDSSEDDITSSPNKSRTFVGNLRGGQLQLSLRSYYVPYSLEAEVVEAIFKKLLLKYGSIPAVTIQFCLTATLAEDDSDIERNLMDLLSANQLLAEDLERYRSALIPHMLSPPPDDNDLSWLLQHPHTQIPVHSLTFGGDSRKGSLVRDFGAYALNLIDTVFSSPLEMNGSYVGHNTSLTRTEAYIVNQCAKAWYDKTHTIA